MAIGTLRRSARLLREVLLDTRRRHSANTLDHHALDATERLYALDTPAVTTLRSLGLHLARRLAPLKHLLATHAGDG